MYDHVHAFFSPPNSIPTKMRTSYSRRDSKYSKISPVVHLPSGSTNHPGLSQQMHRALPALSRLHGAEFVPEKQGHAPILGGFGHTLAWRLHVDWARFWG